MAVEGEIRECVLHLARASSFGVLFIFRGHVHNFTPGQLLYSHIVLYIAFTNFPKVFRTSVEVQLFTCGTRCYVWYTNPGCERQTTKSRVRLLV